MNLMEKYQSKRTTRTTGADLSPGKPKTPPPSGNEGREIEARSLPPYKVVRSEILGDTVLIANTDEDAETLKAAGIEGVIYSLREAKELKGYSPDILKAHHMIKRVFPRAVICHKMS